MPERSTAPLRPTPRRRALPRWVRLGVALAVTAPALVAGVAASSSEDTAHEALAAATETTTDGAEALVAMSDLSERAERASRSSVRTMRVVTMKPRPVDHLWTTAPLNVWAEPGERGKRLGLVKWGAKVAVTGQRVGGWAEVLRGDRGKLVRWVNARYLAAEKPKPKPKPKPKVRSTSSGGSSSGSTGAYGLSMAPCPDGSSIEAGLTPSADRVYRAVCNAFPQLTTYGGLDPHGEHVDGRAIDFMTSDKALGDQIAQFLLANASALNLRDIIWYQRIWTPERASEGWRYMGSRGSATADHMDHVHVAVY